MVSPIGKLNIFSQQPLLPAINSVQAIQGGSSQTAQKEFSNNPFGNTSGVNPNIGIGDTSFLAAQAGKKAGVGRTLAFA
ncbi:MAG: hypothetical protein PHC64_06170 [Candidatus Gastranaerophilales bacterium]|nr:hypothetical protein [Candidatus Gastranaerophilales bacterium]